MVSHITGVTDRLDIAKAAAETVLSSPHAVPVWVISARTGLALMAFMQDDASAAAQQYSALEPQRGTILTGVAALSGEICIDRVLGLLSQTMGKTDDAVVHFEESLEFCREAGYRPELAWACHDYANMLIQRNVSGDLSKARELLDESHQIASDLGMEPLNEKVTALRERLDARPASKPQYPDGLTEREVEVLRLVAAGRTNREIAEILFISVNTVHRHVSHIFSKTDSANRAEAATYANQHGLI
jgi:DNA-binding CsgD family transcriptional regulator